MIDKKLIIQWIQEELIALQLRNREWGIPLVRWGTYRVLKSLEKRITEH